MLIREDKHKFRRTIPFLFIVNFKDFEDFKISPSDNWRYMLKIVFLNLGSFCVILLTADI